MPFRALVADEEDMTTLAEVFDAAWIEINRSTRSLRRIAWRLRTGWARLSSPYGRLAPTRRSSSGRLPSFNLKARYHRPARRCSESGRWRWAATLRRHHSNQHGLGFDHQIIHGRYRVSRPCRHRLDRDLERLISGCATSNRYPRN